MSARSTVSVIEVTVADPLHRQEIDLRYRVLRAPLGMAREAAALAGEESCRHYVAIDSSGAPVGCVLFQPTDPRAGRLRQMAVEPSLQRSGIGRLLVEHLEGEARRDGVIEISMHARVHAIGFYEKLGYALFGEEFLEVGIPHRHMMKRIQSEP